MIIMEIKKRNESFDILRGIGIVLMVMGHIGFGEAFDKYIHTFHMPIFFFVSGYFFNTRDNFKSFFLHLLKTIMVPYTLFVLLCQPLHYIYTREWSLSYFVLSFFTSNRNRIDVAGALWFLLCLFSAKILFYVIIRYAKGIWTCVTVFALTIVSSYMRVKLPLCMDSACSMLLVMYVGYLFSTYKERKLVKRAMNLPIVAAIPLLVMNGILIMLNEPVNIRCNYFGIVPLFWMNALIAILCYYLLAQTIGKVSYRVFQWIKAALTFFGRESIVALVTNEIIIGVIKLAFAMIHLNSGVLGLTLYSFIVLILTLTAIAISAHVIEHTKLKFCIGKF